MNDAPEMLKERTCLKCQLPFLSAGPHNRICPRCSAVNSKIYAPLQSPAPFNGRVRRKSIGSR